MRERTILAPGAYAVPLADYPKCKHCGALKYAVFDASPGGFSGGSEHIHAPHCPELRCEHGVLWAYECEKCEAADEARRKQEAELSRFRDEEYQ